MAIPLRVYTYCKCRLPLLKSAKYQAKAKLEEISKFYRKREKWSHFVMNVSVASPFVLSLQKVMLANVLCVYNQ